MSQKRLEEDLLNRRNTKPLSMPMVLHWHGEWFCSQGTFGNTRRLFGLSHCGVGQVLLESSGRRPGMLPSTVQCTGQPHNREWPRPQCQQCRGWETRFPADSLPFLVTSGGWGSYGGKIIPALQNTQLPPRPLSWQQPGGTGEACAVGPQLLHLISVSQNFSNMDALQTFGLAKPCPSSSHSLSSSEVYLKLST